MTQATTRRDLLRLGTSAVAYAAGAATVTGGIALASEAKGAAPANYRLRRVIALYQRAVSAADRYTDTVEDPAHAACAAAINALPQPPAVPHRSVVTTFINDYDDEIRLSTDSPASVGAARRFVTDPTWADMGVEKWQQAQRELVALADERDAIVATGKAAHQREVEALRERHSLAAIHRRSNQLEDRVSQLWHATMGTPAHSLADVAAKVGFAERTGGVVVPDVVLAAISTDVRRLAQEGR